MTTDMTALTLAAWVARLEAHWNEPVAAAGAEVARTWRLYMSAPRRGFELGEIEVVQLLLARPADGGPARDHYAHGGAIRAARTLTRPPSRAQARGVTEVIQAVGLTKWYGTRRGIQDVEFTVREGEVFGFLGPNGAGKTTTIRLLLGFLRPSAGRASVFGLDAWTEAPAVHSRIAYLGSDPGYLGSLTAAEQLDYLAELRGLARGAWRALAERLELDPSVRIRKLSRGNRQKIGVVAAFMGEAPLLVLDEPSTGLDPLMQREFLSLVSEVRASGRTVFLSSHNLTEVERACQRVGVIREGRLSEIRAVKDLLGDHWRSVNLLLANPAPADHFALENVDVLAQTGREVHLMVRGEIDPLLDRIAALDVEDIAITTPDIEDLFLGHYQAGTGVATAVERGRSGVPS